MNKVTPELYKAFPTPKDLADADVEDIHDVISTITYATNKAKYLKKTGEILCEKFGGEVPKTVEELTELSGVGKKTANAIQQNAFEEVEGVVVDTHVIRLAQRLGWTKEKSPDKIEQDLIKLFPKNSWKSIPHLLKNHGQKVCTAQQPACHNCQLKDSCPSAFSF